jgi:hypothetical protein
VGGYLAEPRTRDDRLRDAARRLATALDRARLYRAAAYASMAGDAVSFDAAQDRFRQARDERARPEGEGGSRIPVRDDGRGVLRRTQDDRLMEQRDIDLDFTLDEQGRVWMIREGDCHILGRAGAVCGEMRRFLADLASGGDGYG